MSIEYLYRIDDGEHPFADLDLPADNVWSREKIDAKKHALEVLNLNTGSSAEEVRRAATTLRLKFEGDGINAETFEALRWALKQTHDVLEDGELLEYMLNEKITFAGLEASRTDFR